MKAKVLYIYDEIERFSDDDYARLYSTLPEDIRKKCDSYKQPIDRKLSLLGYCAMRYALRRECGVEDFGIEVAENGKPFFAESGLPCFNISHCKAGVAVALHTQEIGVDIEEKTSYSEDLAQYTMSQGEVAAIGRSVDRQTAFAELWTKKEAYCKCTGHGLRDDLKTVLETMAEPMEFHSVYGQNYVVTVCTKTLDSILLNPVKVRVADLLSG